MSIKSFLFLQQFEEGQPTKGGASIKKILPTRGQGILPVYIGTHFLHYGQRAVAHILKIGDVEEVR